MVGLRLDTREGAFSERSGKLLIVPGKPQESLLYQRITHEKDALRMPPLASHRKLTDQQKDVVRRWIEQGAKWQEHWSFTVPVRPALPDVSAAKWPRNPIDRFILAKLQTAKLEPAPEANRSTLIRRVSLDLTGLPPTPAEVEAFLNDSSPNAYEKVVDRLLASERYGEHRARYWLDAARYADTHGIHIDNYREMWPYRDWVIQAFNRNMPFDRFTVEQIAGDLLPNRTVEQQIASGFHRCNMTTNEGGSIPEEIDAIYAKDRVDTTATVWLGLTAGCASCHDHKFDPISQKDFYAFAAFFRNITQRAMDGNIPDTPPILVVPKEEDTARWNQLRAEATRLEGDRKDLRTAAQSRFDSWLSETSRTMPSRPLDAGSEYLVVHAEAAALAPGVTRGEGPSKELQALRFGEKAILEFPGVKFEADRPFTIAAWVFLPAGEDNFIVASQSQELKGAKKEADDDDTKTRGWTLEITARIPILKLSGSGGGSIQVRPSNVQRLRPGAWSHLTFTYDGSRDQGGLALYVNGKLTTNEGKGDSTELKGSIKTDVPLRLGGSRTKFFPEGAVADLRVYKRALQADEAEILHRWTAIRNAFAKSPETLTKTEREAILVYYLNNYEAGYRKMAVNMNVVESERRSIRRRAAVTHVMQEKSDSMPMANILYRGQYDQPRDEVQANIPAVLPPLAASAPRNRLGLAEWLVRSDNPLPARVTVNRFWQEFFGMGLVKTAEDFGSQGEAPSHPELLDWMAVEFRESGWDVKKLLRLMVTSATYRQAALSTPQKLQADPENRLLAHGPRFRMDAEMVRDLTLFASGIMNPIIGGPSVKPYQPDGLWETVAMKGSNTRFYKQDHGEKLYRRSMYTFWKRAAPPASMEIFNAPSRENCTVRRERTNTPLQALVTLNDPQFVEASRQLAERAIHAQADAERRLDFLAMTVLSRTWNPRERDVLQRTLRDLKAHYDSNPGAAVKLLAVGESKHDVKIPAVESAAWTMLANNVLNLDEALNK